MFASNRTEYRGPACRNHRKSTLAVISSGIRYEFLQWKKRGNNRSSGIATSNVGEWDRQRRHDGVMPATSVPFKVARACSATILSIRSSGMKDENFTYRYIRYQKVPSICSAYWLGHDFSRRSEPVHTPPPRIYHVYVAI